MNIAVTTHLREVRKSKGLTQKEVAEALLISKDSLSRYERGEQDPRLDVAIRLSKYYNVSMESLYDMVCQILIAYTYHFEKNHSSK